MDLNSQRRLVDQLLQQAAKAKLPERPSAGWASTIRTALGMSARQAGKRMGISQSAVSQLEKAEANKTISLQKLEKLANALGCTLTYQFIPKQPLQEMVRIQAERLYLEEQKKIQKTMALENQSLGKKRGKDSGMQRMVDITSFLLKYPQRLWEE